MGYSTTKGIVTDLGVYCRFRMMVVVVVVAVEEECKAVQNPPPNSKP